MGTEPTTGISWQKEHLHSLCSAEEVWFQWSSGPKVNSRCPQSKKGQLLTLVLFERTEEGKKSQVVKVPQKNKKAEVQNWS